MRSEACCYREPRGRRVRAKAVCAKAREPGFLVATAFAALLLVAGVAVHRSTPENEAVSLERDLKCTDCPATPEELAALRVSLWGDNGTLSREDWSTALVSAASVLLPLVPTLLGDRLRGGGGLDALAAQLLGQSSSFGASEIARRFAVSPDSTFWARCNLTEAECRAHGPATVWLRPPENANSSLCGCPAESDFASLFASLHSLPDLASALAGSALVAFAFGARATLSPGDRRNGGGSLGRAAVAGLLLLALTSFCLLGLLYAAAWARSEPLDLVFSLLCGAGLQLFASFAYGSSRPSSF